MVASGVGAQAVKVFGAKWETLVAFLPLFHTFGRFLELQGMLFWGGRYGDFMHHG